MAKKNKIFSGKGLTEKQRLQIEKQLKIAHERDHAAMERINERRRNKNKRYRQRRLTKAYKEASYSKALTGREAHDKFTDFMDALPEDERDEVRDSGGSGDLLEAADAIADNFESGKSSKYFNKQDFIDMVKQLQEEHLEEVDDDIILF